MRAPPRASFRVTTKVKSRSVGALAPLVPGRTRFSTASSPVRTVFCVASTSTEGPSLMATLARSFTTWPAAAPSTSAVTRTWKLTEPVAFAATPGMVQVTLARPFSGSVPVSTAAPSPSEPPTNLALPSTYSVPAGTSSVTTTLAAWAAPVESTAVLAQLMV